MEGRGMRVMSFNVRGASHRDGINAWPGRAGINVRTIKTYAPDLIGLQEVHAPNLEVYERDLPGYEKIMGPAYGTDTVEEFAAIFYDAERFERLDARGRAGATRSSGRPTGPCCGAGGPASRSCTPTPTSTT